MSTAPVTRRSHRARRRGRSIGAAGAAVALFLVAVVTVAWPGPASATGSGTGDTSVELTKHAEQDGKAIDSTTPLLPGDTFDYVITVTNTGTTKARTIKVTDDLPATVEPAGPVTVTEGATLVSTTPGGRPGQGDDRRADARWVRRRDDPRPGRRRSEGLHDVHELGVRDLRARLRGAVQQLQQHGDPVRRLRGPRHRQGREPGRPDRRGRHHHLRHLRLAGRRLRTRSRSSRSSSPTTSTRPVRVRLRQRRRHLRRRHRHVDPGRRPGSRRPGDDGLPDAQGPVAWPGPVSDLREHRVRGADPWGRHPGHQARRRLRRRHHPAAGLWQRLDRPEPRQARERGVDHHRRRSAPP